MLILMLVLVLAGGTYFWLRGVQPPETLDPNDVTRIGIISMRHQIQSSLVQAEIVQLYNESIVGEKSKHELSGSFSVNAITLFMEDGKLIRLEQGYIPNELIAHYQGKETFWYYVQSEPLWEIIAKFVELVESGEDITPELEEEVIKSILTTAS